MIGRSFDVARINEVANNPDVRPFIGGKISEPLDVSELVADHSNYALFGQHGGFVYAWCAPAIYEVHTLILTEGRGKWALDAAKMSLAMMAKDGAERVWTRVREDMRGVRAFTIAAGMRSRGCKMFDLGGGLASYALYDWKPSCL